MKKLGLALCFAAVLTLTACEKKKTSDVTTQSKPAVASSSKPAAVASRPTQSVASSVPDVTFTEQDYEKLCRSIKLGDRTLEFPCEVKELAPEFVVDKDAPHITGTDLVTYKLRFNGALAGEVKIRYGEGDDPDNLDTLEDNKLAELTVYLLDIKGTEGLKNSFSVGSVDFYTIQAELTAQFGQPDETVEFGISGDLRYLAGSGKAVVFRVNGSNTVGRITISEIWQ